MFRLTIDLPATATVWACPGREVARAELLRFLDETGHAHRVTQASWTHTSYDIIDLSGHQTPPVLGRAVIEEVCGCEHTEDDHDEGGCTFACFDAGRLVGCRCPRYEPVPGDPTLFDDAEAAFCVPSPPRPT